MECQVEDIGGHIAIVGRFREIDHGEQAVFEFERCALPASVEEGRKHSAAARSCRPHRRKKASSVIFALFFSAFGFAFGIQVDDLELISLSGTKSDAQQRFRFAGTRTAHHHGMVAQGREWKAEATSVKPGKIAHGNYPSA